jgi:Winged helix DNA-binding domain
MQPSPALKLDWDHVAGWRQRGHHLDRRAARGEMLAVTSRIAGLHAQVMSSAAQTLWARVDSLEPSAVADALWRDRTLVKTWAMRGTLHLLPADELPLWQAGQSTRRAYERGAWQRGFGITLEQIEAMLAAVSTALEGRTLSREALAGEVARVTGSTELGTKLRSGWGSMLKPAAYRGHLCFAPSDGQRVRFTRPDTWLGAWTEHDPEAAVLETARRFIAVAGSVTREDYARWWGVQPAEGGRVLKRLGDELVPVEVEGEAAWMLAKHAGGIAEAAPVPSVRLLPAFDQYVVTATRHAERLMPGPFKDRVYRPQGWLSPVVLVDGRIVGIWRQEAKGRRLLIAVEPFAKLTPRATRGVAEEAERLAAWSGATLELSWTAA